MILTDYLPACRNAAWNIALECGVKYGTIRLPEDVAFDPTSLSQLRTVTDRFRSAGIEPLVLEPLPNALHDHIKAGDALRDSSVDMFILQICLRESPHPRHPFLETRLQEGREDHKYPHAAAPHDYCRAYS